MMSHTQHQTGWVYDRRHGWVGEPSQHWQIHEQYPLSTLGGPRGHRCAIFARHPGTAHTVEANGCGGGGVTKCTKHLILKFRCKASKLVCVLPFCGPELVDSTAAMPLQCVRLASGLTFCNEHGADPNLNGYGRSGVRHICTAAD